MRKRICIIYLILILPFMLFAADEVIAVTLDGAKVILNSDFTWAYAPAERETLVEEPNDLPITLQNFEITPRFKNYDLERYSDDVILSLYVKNNSGKKITGYRLFVRLRNAFGDHLSNLTLTVGDSILEPGEEDFPQFLWEDNQFIEEEVYDYLVTYSASNLKLTLTDAVVIYAP